MKLKDIIKNDISNARKVNKGRLAMKLPDLHEPDPLEGLRGRNGKDGKDGYTPIKGEDYYTEEEAENLKELVTPVKGVDYKDGRDGEDGLDGYTPIKGKDYFDGKDGKNGKDGYSPIKGKDYFDGKDGKDGKNGITTVIKKEEDLSAKEIIKRIENEPWEYFNLTGMTEDELVNVVDQPSPKLVNVVDTQKKELNKGNKKEKTLPDVPSGGVSKPAKQSIPAALMNPMKDAIVQAFGWDSAKLTRQEWGVIQNAAKALCEANYQP
jgi:hypothetical protein